MAMNTKELKRWLDKLDEEDDVYIDEGGLSLRSRNERFAYIEVGGEAVEYDALMEGEEEEAKLGCGCTIKR